MSTEQKPDYMTDEEWEEWKKSNKIPRREGTLKISVDSEQMKRLLKENVKLEKGSEEFDKFRDSVMKHARRVLNNDEIEALDDTTFEGLGEIVSAFKKREKWLNEEENRESPSGVTRLNSAQRGKGSSKGFDSYEALIDSLTEQEHSDNAQERAYAKKVKDEMFRKVAQAIKKGELTQPISYTPKEGKSFVREFLDRQNERMRRKILKKRGEKNEN